ncbi:MFS transporter [Microlunatus speluncae]|uniref:MFS transporter n=1 Tax=Microlunatus speluncae TaxID=2594267 RepID=UPI00137619DF|nr:MFS transporter [Microlunatus speluncae]
MNQAGSQAATRRRWAGLAILLLPAVLTSMDISVLFVAGPTITDQLRLTPTQWLWAMDLYGFVMAGLLITMGGLGDRFGRRRLLLIGGLGFGAASVLVAFAPTGELLIAGRGLLAVGGAALAPSTLSLIRELFVLDHERRLALGAWTAAFAGGAVCGPIVAGILLDHFWWGSVFLLNVPAMLLLLCLAPILVPESRVRSRTRFDVVGAGTSLLTVLCLVFALKRVVLHGFDPSAIGAATIGLASMIIFVLRQLRTTDPLIDVTLFRSRPFSVGVVANVVVAATTGGVGVLVFPYLQVVHGLSPFWSAVCGLPCLAGSFLGAAVAARLAPRLPTGPAISLGLVCCAIGLAGSGLTAGSPTYGGFLVGYTILIFGCGLTATLATSVVIGQAPETGVGAAAGLSESSNQLGTGLGIAVFGVLATASYRENMDPANDPSAARSLTDAIVAAQTLSDHEAGALLHRAHAAYAASLEAVVLVAALGTGLLAAAPAVLLHRSRGRTDLGGPSA